MTWKERYKDKYRTPEEAVKVIESGQTVMFPIGPPSTPQALAKALADRWEELENVTVDTTFSFAVGFGLLEPGRDKAFKLRTFFTFAPPEQILLTQKNPYIDFARMTPTFFTNKVGGHARDTAQEILPDVFMFIVSPPNEQGFCSFGAHLWHNRSLARLAKVCIAEVDPEMPRTGGQNYIHVDEIDYLVDTQVILAPLRELVVQVSPHEEEASTIIGGYVATLIQHGDCLEIGGGAMSMRATAFMDNFIDLGIHSEAIMPGQVTLMKQGVATCKRKNIHPGKAIGTGVMWEPGDKEFVDGNPMIELYDMEYNNSPKIIAQNDNMVAINACLAVDLYGQIAVEKAGPRYFAGIGGQYEFVMGALWSKGGRSIHVMPATTTNGESHIMPLHPPGSVVTVPSICADFVVTEYGIASLMHKTERQRAEEIIAVAHPDHRAELKKEMQKLLYSS
ncbi:MAG: acetyl-CoA hydrolase/transferase C-terminal domain-containing protein [Chloroflexota bacterium]|nr:acetyl-CoA hydrolase/transferase C-terminal domain-containing protein [Chloroflexota bacterium]